MPTLLAVVVSIVALLLAAAPSQAEDPRLIQKVQRLEKQVRTFQSELRTIKRIVNLERNGATSMTARGDLAVSVGGHGNLQVGRNLNTHVGVDQNVRVGRRLSTTVDGDRVLTVRKNATTQVGQDWSLTVAKNFNQQSVRDTTVAAGRRVLITAGDQLTLRAGSASIVLRKNGDISISGKKINIKGSGDVVIKGAKVTTD